MDSFWSGLARRAAEYTRIDRRSQFSGIHETAIQALEKEKSLKNQLLYFKGILSP